MKKSNRRDFLRKSILGVSGAALIPANLNAAFARSNVKAIPTLPSRILGRTGIKTPLISMGTSGATSPNFVRTAYDAGIKLFFSATYYGEGNNEKLVGEGLKGLPRDSYVIGTAASPDGMDTRTGTLTKELDVNLYIQKAENSLKRFGLDYVDVFLFPYAGKREVMLNQNLLKAMQELKKQGKIRFAGVASHNNVEEALKAAADSQVYDVVMPAYNYKTKNQEAMNEALAYAAKAGVGIIAMKTTAGAFRDKSGTTPLNTDAALKWVLQNENITSIVSGMSSVEQLQKNITMIENLKITDQELKDINLAGLRSEPSLYCHQCPDCISQCPHQVDVPTLMRSYMYAYGYRNMEHARHILQQVDLSGNPCSSCGTCSINCISGFDIKGRIQDIARLNDVPKEFLLA
jgi:aryl-alcohol dehydrogenase-like predicted oxidoreductase